MASVEFGITTWGRAWLRVIERINAAPNPKLPNARRLARGIDDDIEIEAGLITALVEAKSVRIQVRPWTEAQLTVVDRLLSSAGVRGAAGDLPDALVEELKQSGIEVACELEALQVSCTCRSRTENCAHMLAVIYGIVLLVDQQPTRAVEIRSPRLGAAKVLSDPDWIPLADIDPDHFFALDQ